MFRCWLGNGIDAELAAAIGIAHGIPWHRRGAWRRAALPLGDVPAEHLVVPSFCALGDDYGFRFALTARDAEGRPVRAVLAGVGRGLAARPARASPAIAAPIDAFETQAPLRDAVLHVVVSGARPRSEWLAVGVRPVAIDPEAGTRTATTAAATPAYSQMRLDDTRRSRVCSPVCLAMAVSALGVPSPRSRFLAAVHHSAMYGVWPANIHAASRAGVLGAVCTFTSSDELAALLRQGAGIVVSTRWREGELDGAPLPASAGHLMLLRDLDADHAGVHDPAAPDDAGVPRRYPRGQFVRIALAARGVAYVLLPSGLPDRSPAHPSRGSTRADEHAA